MRFIAGIIVGVLIAVGAAYIHDASVTPGPETQAQRLVNWPAVSDSLRSVDGWLRDEVAWLNQQLRREG